MSKSNFSKRVYSFQSPVINALHSPVMPIERKQEEDKRMDPSSCQPKGKSYPMPSFFEYRVNPKEYDFV